MIPCEEVRRHLMDYHYNLLADWEAEEIRLHLPECAGCRSEYEQVGEDIVLIDLNRAPDLKADLWKKMELRLKAEFGTPASPASPWRRVWNNLHPPASLRAVAVTLGVALLIWFGVSTVGTLSEGEFPLAAYARDYRLLEQDPRPTQYSAPTRAQLVSWLNDRTGFPPLSPDLCPEGLDLLGVRMGLWKGEPVGLWVYRLGSDEVLLFERREDGAALPSSPVITSGGYRFHLHRDRGLNLLSWTSKGRAFTVVAPMDPQEMAERISRCLRREAGHHLSAGLPLGLNLHRTALSPPGI